MAMPWGGRWALWSASSWWARRRAKASATPRTALICAPSALAGGRGTRARSPRSMGAPWPKVTSSSSLPARARMVAVVARLKASRGPSPSWWLTPLLLNRLQGQRSGGAGEVLPEAALVVLSHDGALRFVALVQEGHAEGEGKIIEDFRILGPGNHRPGRHHDGQLAANEAPAREVRDGHHLGDLPSPLLRRPRGNLREHDVRFRLRGQVVQGRDDIPPVHLALVDLLGAVIEPRGIPEADGVGRRKEAEAAVGRNHPVLIEKRELALHLEDPLDHEHDVRAARIIFVEHQGHGALQGPRQKPFPKLRNLLAILQHDGVLADKVDPADVGIEIDPDAGPIQPRGHLLDMGRFPRAVIALHHDAPVVREAGQNR